MRAELWYMSHAASAFLLIPMWCLIHGAFFLSFSFLSCCVSTSSSESVTIKIFPWREWSHNLESDPIHVLLFWGYLCIPGSQCQEIAQHLSCIWFSSVCIADLHEFCPDVFLTGGNLSSAVWLHRMHSLLTGNLRQTQGSTCVNQFTAWKVLGHCQRSLMLMDGSLDLLLL